MRRFPVFCPSCPRKFFVEECNLVERPDGNWEARCKCGEVVVFVKNPFQAPRIDDRQN